MSSLWQVTNQNPHSTTFQAVPMMMMHGPRLQFRLTSMNSLAVIMHGSTKKSSSKNCLKSFLTTSMVIGYHLTSTKARLHTKLFVLCSIIILVLIVVQLYQRTCQHRNSFGTKALDVTWMYYRTKVNKHADLAQNREEIAQWAHDLLDS